MSKNLNIIIYFLKFTIYLIFRDMDKKIKEYEIKLQGNLVDN